MKDVVIVGGGLAGLSAAWRLRHWDISILESSERIGGRIKSEQRGQYFLNWGGHVFSGPNTSTNDLFQETGTRVVDVPGSLSGLSMNGKLLVKGPVQTYPLRLPLPLRSKLAMITSGAKVSADVLRYAKVVRRRPGESGESRQQRIYDFENDRTFADYLGDVPADAEALFRPTVTRSAGDPEEISAGAGIGYFSLVWNVGQGLSRSIAGGPSTLTETIAASQRQRIELGAQVNEVVQHEDHVVVRYTQAGVEHEVTARTAVLATPAPISHRVAVNLPTEQHEALGKIRYGSYVSAAFLTNETEAQPWDGAYGIATPNRSFNVALNMGNIVRGSEDRRQPGGSIMTFSPASLANQLMPRTDEEILRTYLDDLNEVLPGFENIVEEAHVQRWKLGAPYCFPGRAKLQGALMRPARRVFLAGDYLGSLYTETAITSAFTAAQRAASLLASEHRACIPLTDTSVAPSAPVL